jgi:cytochrome c oxidase subunit I
VFIWNVWVTRNNPKVGVDDPWGWGASLEWATSCPPPRHNFHRMPRIRSERPAFDLKFPEVAAAELAFEQQEAGLLTKTLGPADREPVSEQELRASDDGRSGRPEEV